ncbi:hypothetical protein KCU73_g303, partial [Aureobasidium melanogenum]
MNASSSASKDAMYPLPEGLMHSVSQDQITTLPQGSTLPDSTLACSPLPIPTPLDSIISTSEDLAAGGSESKDSMLSIRRHISERNLVLEGPFLKGTLLQIQILTTENQEYQQELEDKDTTIEKQETLVLTLNQEIIEQDNAIFDLQRRNRQQNAALMEKDRVITELETKVKSNKELLAEIKEQDRSIAALNYTLYANLTEGEKLECENKLLRKEIKKRLGRSLRSMITGSLRKPRASQALTFTSQPPDRSPTAHQPDQGKRSTSHSDSPSGPSRISRYPSTSTPSGQIQSQEPVGAALDHHSVTRVERGRSHHPQLEVNPRLRDRGIRGWLGSVRGEPSQSQRMFRCSYEDLVDASRAVG